RGAAADDEASGAHRLDAAPAEHERVGEVNMARRDLQHLQVLLVRQAADEMEARKAELAFYFVKKDTLPGLARGRGRAVRDAVAADDQHARVRAPAQDLGQRAHED